MFEYINNIDTLDGLFTAAKHSSCPECAGVMWGNGEFVPASSLFEDQLMAEAFNDQFTKLINNIK